MGGRERVSGREVFAHLGSALRAQAVRLGVQRRQELRRRCHRRRPPGYFFGGRHSLSDSRDSDLSEADPSREEVGAQLARDAEKPKSRWIWIYHAPPETSPTSWDGQKFYGDAYLLKWIEQYQPDIVLTGHIHQSPFRKGGSWVDRLGSTWVFNPGRQIGPSPTHVIFNTAESVALWFSLAGAEFVQLDQSLRRPVAELTALPDWLTTS